MARRRKGSAKKLGPESRRPQVAKSRLRLASETQTDSIKDNFPPGIARPALRALFAAGLTTLDQLARKSEADVSKLHGMGPKAIVVLRAALKAKGLDFRSG